MEKTQYRSLRPGSSSAFSQAASRAEAVAIALLLVLAAVMLLYLIATA